MQILNSILISLTTYFLLWSQPKLTRKFLEEKHKRSFGAFIFSQYGLGGIFIAPLIFILFEIIAFYICCIIPEMLGKMDTPALPFHLWEYIFYISLSLIVIINEANYYYKCKKDETNGKKFIRAQNQERTH